MKKILGIYGAGGQGRETLELSKIINQRTGHWENTIFIVDNPTQKCVNGISVYAYDEMKQLFGEDYSAI